MGVKIEFFKWIYLKASLAFLFFSVEVIAETLPPLSENNAPQTWNEAWNGFDPRKEPLDVEILKEWEEDGVVLRVLRYRIGIFKGKKAMMAGVYGFPKDGKELPGLVQIHGGGQYADYRAPLSNAKRGYATISISWAGRISAPNYRVTPDVVKLFWDKKIKDPKYKLTTDWGALDAYHAPSKYGKDAFPSIPVEKWTLDSIESPRNNAWFLASLGARRALTFLENRPEVNGDKLGVYGHSMGGKLTVLTAGSDSRVKVAVPSCGGISDRYSKNPLHLATVSDPPSLKNISCPIFFQSPSNDFHGRINDLPISIDEIKSVEWRVNCSPHHNHQDSPEYEVASQIWFDHHLKNGPKIPKTPKLDLDFPRGGDPIANLIVDESREVLSIDIFYTQQGQIDGEKDNSTNTKNRFWHHSGVIKTNQKYSAKIPLFSLNKPLWVYANVTYRLDTPIRGAGYYYGLYEAEKFTISSLMSSFSPEYLLKSEAIPTLKTSKIIEDFMGDWRKEWFSYNKQKWGIKTHKLYHPMWNAPDNSKLYLELRAESSNKMIIGLDEFVTELNIHGSNKWQSYTLSPSDFKNFQMISKKNWKGIKELKIDESEALRPPKGTKLKPIIYGAKWKGSPPEFKSLRWM